ncbi:hypothetical protein MTO96_017582 [Rhipicephalus appendiculatus]
MARRVAALFLMFAVLVSGIMAIGHVDDATAPGVFSASAANEHARIDGRQAHVERNDLSGANEEARIFWPAGFGDFGRR